MQALTFLRRSLSTRLLVTIAGWTLIALVMTSILLAAAFRQNAERNFENLLRAHAFNLMGAIDVSQQGRLIGKPNLRDPRFLAPLSGWSWAVSAADNPTIPLLYSDSLTGEAVVVADISTVPFNDQFQRSYTVESDETIQRRIEAQLFLGEGDRLYQIMVSGNQAEIDDATGAFMRQLIIFLSLFGLGTIIVAALAVRFGLRPLKDARLALNSVREGERETITGEFPIEIQPLIGEINALIVSNRSVTERARMQVGNLAHALKTPLAVMKNEATRLSGDKAAIMREQTDTMQAQITNYLNRARIASQAGTLKAKTEIEPIAQRLVRVMRKLSPNLNFHITVASGLNVAVEQQDLEEILGNLLENASHYAKTAISINVEAMANSANGKPQASFVVEDDGGGIAPEKFDEVLKRGKRLDETVPGSGLGLSIVKDIVEEYGGSIELGKASLGGLRVAIILPALHDKTR